MTCREFTAFIADYLDDVLPEDDGRRFARHLERCVNCAGYLQHYREAMALGKRAFEDGDAPVPGDVPDELVDAILRLRGSRPTEP